jgi:2'-5' RNA ligase
MDQHKDSVMIALLPITTDWCKIELPHLTLVYAGESKDLPYQSYVELTKDASSLAAMNRPLALEVSGEDLFGPERDTSVLTLRPSIQLKAMRHFVERWNKSEFDFNPHVTVGGTTDRADPVPAIIAFDRVYVGWGGSGLSFSMKL